MVLHYRYPLDPAPRVLLIGAKGTGMGTPLHAAEALAAPARVLSDLCLPGWQPSFPFVAFTGPAFGFLTGADRENLWRRWGVPVFEQLVSPAMEIVAEECEAHDGLHLTDPDWNLVRGEIHFRGGPVEVTATIETAPCGCGLATPRLRDIAPYVAPPRVYWVNGIQTCIGDGSRLANA